MMIQRIAIVAGACEYPEAPNPAELWRNVLCRRKSFRQIPPERLRLDDYLGHDDDPDSICRIEAALIEGYEFPRERFRIPLATYDSADLAHWLALDVASRAISQLQDFTADRALTDTTAVVVGNSLAGEFSRAGLMRYRWPFVARALHAAWADATLDTSGERAFADRLRQLYKSPFAPPTEESLAGGLANTIAGRIANYFGLRGGAFTVDGACASSLVAVISACEKLVLGDARCVVMGAVDLSLDPFELVGFTRNGALSRRGMRVFDQDSDGFWPGEGSGFLVLTTESEALERGWSVLGWIRGWGMSTDGHGGLTRPTVDGQKLALARAYARAGVEPSQVAYFEAHGTGTPTGDPVELQALAEFLESAGATASVPVGSIKANIGHTKAAAGLAGVLKALSVTRSRIVPPSTGLDTPTPILRDGRVGRYLRLTGDAEAIGQGSTVVVGVNGFGFGGINCHVIVEGPASCDAPDLSAVRFADTDVLPDLLFAFAAPDRESLEASIRRIYTRAKQIARSQLIDVAASLRAALADHAWRAYVVAAEPAELDRALDAVLKSLEQEREQTSANGHGWGWSLSGSGEPRIAFLFSGQGQSFELEVERWRRRFPMLSDSVECIRSLLHHDPLDTAVTQPLLAEIGIAGLALLSRFGVKPHWVLGHSFGEMVALYAAGAYSKSDLRRLAAARGRIMSECGAGRGAMVAFHGPAEAASALAVELDLDVACHNGAERWVLSGTPEAARSAVNRAVAMGLDASLLPTSVAFHSRQMEAARAPFATTLKEAHFEVPKVPVISTITGAPLEGEDLIELLLAQLTRPVLFDEALRAAGPVDVFLEVGSGHVLSALAGGISPAQRKSLGLFGGSQHEMLDAVGACWIAGVSVDMEVLFEGMPLRPFGALRRPVFLANPCERIEALEPPLHLDVPSQPPLEPTRPRLRDAASRPAIAVLIEIIAETSGLSPESISPESRLLSDLHLNSIRARHLMASAARQLGIETLPFELADIANASVSTVADRLEKVRMDSGDQRRPVDEADAVPAGIAHWVRAYSHDWRASPAPIGRMTVSRRAFVLHGDWQRLGPEARRWLGGDSSSEAPPAAALLSTGATEDELRSLLEASQGVAGGAYEGLLIVQDAGRCTAFARSLALEHPAARICVVHADELSPSIVEFAIAEYESVPSGFTETRYGSDELRMTRTLELIPSHARSAEAYRLGRGDVALVTGGAKGIGAEIAFHLGHAYQCRVALIGRSPESDAEVQAALERLSRAGIEAAYAAADLADAEATVQAVRTLEQRLGPISVLVHGAGINVPTPVRELTLEDLVATVRSKVDSLDHVLSALRPGQLKLLVAQSSIIAEVGLEGEAHYALANEWLNGRLAQQRSREPDCVCIPICWTAWGSVGMATKLPGVLDHLARAGVRAIETAEALAMLDESIARGDSGPVVITGRYGRRSDPATDRFDALHFRFLEHPRVFYPGVELIADTDLSTDTDLYLHDHAPYGVPVLPLVFALEAMVQGARVLTGRNELPEVEDLRIEQPITFAWGERSTVRIALLVGTDGGVEAQVRAASTAFAVPHFAARLKWTSYDDPDVEYPPLIAEPCPATALYDGLVFHGSLFRHVDSYRLLNARRCVATTRAGSDGQLYSRLIPSRFAAGNAAIRDSVLHALQVCVPHSAVLPSGVGTIRLGKLDAGEHYTVVARETWNDGSEYLFDIDVLSAVGRLTERWTGLRLTKVHRGEEMSSDEPKQLAPPLIVPLVERMVEEAFGEGDFAAGVSSAPPLRPQRAEAALAMALGGPVHLRHATTGEPLVDGVEVSLSHTEAFTLAVASRSRRVACDVEFPPSCGDDEWKLMLGDERFRAAQHLAATLREPLLDAACRVWVSSECLEKLGVGSWPFSETGALSSQHTETGRRALLSAPEVRIAVTDFTLAGGTRGFVGVALAPAGFAAGVVAVEKRRSWSQGPIMREEGGQSPANP